MKKNIIIGLIILVLFDLFGLKYLLEIKNKYIALIFGILISTLILLFIFYIIHNSIKNKKTEVILSEMPVLSKKEDAAHIFIVIVKNIVLILLSSFFLAFGGMSVNKLDSTWINLGFGNFIPYIISIYIVYNLIKSINLFPKKRIYIIPLVIYIFLILTSFFISYKNTNKIIKINNNKINHIAWENKDSILSELNQNFKEPRIVKDVGITKYRDFYIITNKDEILIPYPRVPKNTESDQHVWGKSDILSDPEKLLNLKKIIGQQIDVKALASSKIPYGFVVKGINFKDNYPLNNNEYFMVEIIVNDKVLNINNFELCNTEKDKELDYYCDNIYQGQRWMGM